VEFPLEITAPRSSVTVKIHAIKNRGRQSFMLVWYADNARKREFRAEFDEAKSRALEVSGDAGKGIIQSVALSTRQRDDYLAALPYAEALNMSVLDIVRHYSQAVEIMDGDHVIEAARLMKKSGTLGTTAIQLEKAVKEFIEQKRKDEKPGRRSYADDLERMLKKFYRVLRMNVGEITAQDLALFFGTLNCEPRTFNNHRSAVVSFFKWCQNPARRYLPAGWNEYEAIETKSDDDEAIEIFTPDELKRLLEASPTILLPFLCIGAFAGVRSDEIRKLTWADVKIDRGFIEVGKDKAKTAARRLAPISQNLAAWLRRCRRPAGSVWPHSKPYLYELLRSTCTAANVTPKANALRHSFISYRVAQAQDVPKVALEAGNSPKMIFQHYRELVTGDDAKEWFAIMPPKTRRQKGRPKNVIELKQEAA